MLAIETCLHSQITVKTHDYTPNGSDMQQLDAKMLDLSRQAIAGIA